MPRMKSLDKYKLEDLQEAITRKMERLRQLEQQRDEHERLYRELTREIRKLGGSGRRVRRLMAGTGRGGRPRSGPPLHQYVSEVLSRNKKGMRPADIVTGVEQAGYKTSGDNLYSMVHQALKKLMEGGQVAKDEASKTYKLA